VSITFLPELFSGRLIYARQQTDKREFSGVSPGNFTVTTTWLLENHQNLLAGIRVILGCLQRFESESA
jgi:hypothetical protein